MQSMACNKHMQAASFTLFMKSCALVLCLHHAQAWHKAATSQAFFLKFVLSASAQACPKSSTSQLPTLLKPVLFCFCLICAGLAQVPNVSAEHSLAPSLKMRFLHCQYVCSGLAQVLNVSAAYSPQTCAALLLSMSAQA